MAELVQVSITVAAPPAAVYALVADLNRMGEWSPEATGIRWLGGATAPTPGARFRGTNRVRFHRWATMCTIETAEPGAELSWTSSTMGLPVALWRYEFAPDADGGTLVTESTEDRRGALVKAFAPMATGVSDRAAHNAEGMRQTLERIKAEAEKAPA